MEIAADYERPLGSVRVQAYAGLAGEPALGPHGVSASCVGVRESDRADYASLARCDAHRLRCRHRGRLRTALEGRGFGVQWPRARRVARQSRSRRARLERGARLVAADRSLGGPGVRRPLARGRSRPRQPGAARRRSRDGVGDLPSAARRKGFLGVNRGVWRESGAERDCGAARSDHSCVAP